MPDHVAPQSGPTCYPAHDHRSAASCLDLRSEEHTSELKSQSNLVCRLLLEIKKLCQQVATRRLRRLDYTPDPQHRRLTSQYADLSAGPPSRIPLQRREPKDESSQ